MNRPKMMDQARPLKMGSKVMGQAPRRVVPAVRKMGRRRTAPASMMASLRGWPRSEVLRMKSMRMMALRWTMPPSAIMPIMAVAVKKTGSG